MRLSVMALSTPSLTAGRDAATHGCGAGSPEGRHSLLDEDGWVNAAQGRGARTTPGRARPSRKAIPAAGPEPRSPDWASRPAGRQGDLGTPRAWRGDRASARRHRRPVERHGEAAAGEGGAGRLLPREGHGEAVCPDGARGDRSEIEAEEPCHGAAVPVARRRGR